DPERERWFTRAASAELLIDAGAVVTPSVTEGILRSRARGLLQLFQRKGLLPQTLKFHAALGDLDAVRAALDKNGNDFATVNEAFVRACSFGHEAVASMLLERLIALDPELGEHIDESVGRHAFVRYFIEKGSGDALTAGPWKAFVMQQVSRALQDGDLTAFVSGIERAPWLLGEAFVDFQNGLLSTAAYVSTPSLKDRGDFIAALLDRDPAIRRRQPPPRSQAIEHAITYGHTHLLPMLTRIWPLPDDLPHAAGVGNLERVKQWFGASGAPTLGDVHDHFPHTSVHQEAYDDWGVSSEQKVLDTALAWSVINHHFDVADFLLAHGADINTRWNSHEPASILHHLVFEDDYDAMRFLIDRGIDMTIDDYRWNSTAQGWARYGKSDEKMAQWLADAERRRNEKALSP
ncbi:MAG TPA: ankyrin repeat domain-containing protein, partial [Gemmatimonadaceae bacterium]|nr:ankyrin repeat domain-containing protein [Gemmatimonadaceae bacterium]